MASRLPSAAPLSATPSTTTKIPSTISQTTQAFLDNRSHNAVHIRHRTRTVENALLCGTHTTPQQAKFLGNRSQNIANYRRSRTRTVANAIPFVPSGTPQQQQAAFLDKGSESAINFQHNGNGIVAGASCLRNRNASPIFRTPSTSKFRSPASTKIPISTVSRIPRLPSYLWNVTPRIDTNLRSKTNTPLSTPNAQQSIFNTPCSKINSSIDSSTPTPIASNYKNVFGMKRTLVISPTSVGNITNARKKKAIAVQTPDYSTPDDILRTVAIPSTIDSPITALTSSIANSTPLRQNQEIPNSTPAIPLSVTLDLSIIHEADESSTRLASRISVFGNAALFLEEEANIFAEQKCKCEKFESIVKEYTALKQQTKSESANVAAVNTEESIVGVEEVEKLNAELNHAKLETEIFKSEAQTAAKELENFKFQLDEEKRLSKNHIADLERELEILKNEAASKNEDMALLKEKLQHFDAIVQKRNEAEARCNQMKANSEKLEREKIELEQKLEAMKVEMDEKDVKIEQDEFRAVELQKDKLVLINEIEILKNEATSKNDKMAAMKEKLQQSQNEIQKENEKINLKLNQAIMEVEKFKKASENAERDIENIRFEYDEEKLRVANLQKTNIGLYQELEIYKNDAASKLEEMAVMKEELQNLDHINRKCNEAEMLCNVLKENIENVGTEKANLVKSLEETRVQFNGIKDTYARIDEERQSLMEQNRELQNANLVLSDDLKIAKNSVAETALELMELKAKLQHYDGEVQKRIETETLSNKMREQFEIICQEKTNMEQTIKELNIQLNGMQEKNAEIVDEKRYLNDRIYKLRNSNFTLTHELKALKNDATESALMKEEISKLKEKLQQHDVEVQKRIVSEFLWNQAKKNYEKFEKKKAELEQRLVQTEKENVEKDEEKRSLQDRITSLQNLNSAFNSKLEILQNGRIDSSTMKEELKKEYQLIHNADQKLAQNDKTKLKIETAGELDGKFMKQFVHLKKEMFRAKTFQETNAILQQNSDKGEHEHIPEVEALQFQLKSIVEKKNKEISKLKEILNQSKLTVDTTTDVESDAEKMDVVDNDYSEDNEKNIHDFESLPETDPYSQNPFIYHKKPPQIQKYVEITGWKFVKSGAVSSGIIIFPSSNDNNDDEIQMKFLGKHSNGYLFQCGKCENMKGGFKNFGKAFLALENGSLKLKTGAHVPACKKIIGI